MKSILLSVQPKWVEKILNGEKKVEIRKTMPKCKWPVDVYIYCTKQGYMGTGIWAYGIELKVPAKRYLKSGKVVAKFTLKFADKYCADVKAFVENFPLAYEKSCIGEDELSKYIGENDYIYVWYIADLEIFDKPMELRDFKVPCKYCNDGPDYFCPVHEIGDLSECGFYENGECKHGYIPLQKPPQSWQYVNAPVAVDLKDREFSIMHTGLVKDEKLKKMLAKTFDIYFNEVMK